MNSYLEVNSPNKLDPKGVVHRQSNIAPKYGQDMLDGGGV